MITKALKSVVKKSITINIKHDFKRKKFKAYSFSCKNFKHKTQKDKVIMKNKVIREKSRCFNSNHKSTFLNQHKKVNIEPPKFSLVIEHFDLLLKMQKRYRKGWFKNVRN